MACPISNAETRLADAAVHWKQAHGAYFDPANFRLNIQASIQAFRSVTFLLQKAKDSIPGFDPWYAQKRSIMRQDKRMKWLVEARNKIEKHGDLDTHSLFEVEYSDSWLSPAKRIFNIPPSSRPEDMATVIASMYPKSKCTEGAILKLTRKWVDSEFPDEEILAVLIYVYSRLINLLLEAHGLFPQTDIASCEFHSLHSRSAAELPEFMIGLQFPATSWFSLKEGKLRAFEEKLEKITLADAKNTVQNHYDGFRDTEIDLAPGSSFVRTCTALFNRGKHMLQTDGYHSMIAIIYTERGIHLARFRPADRADKHIMVRELASKCERLQAIACVIINEAWVAPPSSQHGPYAVNHPDRQEALSLVGFHRDEGFESRIVIFERQDGRIQFRDDELTPIPSPDLLTPVSDAIKSVWRER